MQAAKLHPNILLSESQSRWLARQDVGHDGTGTTQISLPLHPLDSAVCTYSLLT